MGSAGTMAPPDGGYGWVIVLAATLQLVLGSLLLPLFPVVFGPKFKEIGASSTEIYSAYSTFIVFWQLASIFVGPLGEMKSERFVAVLATCLQVVGLLVSAFSTSIIHLVIGFSAIWGCGLGVSNTNSIIILNKYFKNRVGLANGLLLSSISIIGLILPQVVKILLENLVFKYVLIIYAGMTFISGLVGSLLICPVTRHLVAVKEETEEKEEASLRITKEELNEDSNQASCRIFSLIKWSLLKDPYFLIIAAVNSICFSAVLVQLPQISIIAKDLNLSLDQRANLVSILSATNIISRICQGFVGDLSCLAKVFKHPKKFLFILSSICLSGSMVAMAFTQTFFQMIFVVCLTSFCNSGILLNSSQVYRECFSDKFSSAIGLASLFRAFFALTMGPLAGFLKGYFQDFRASLYFLAIGSFLSMLVLVLIDCYCSNKDERRTSPAIVEKKIFLEIMPTKLDVDQEEAS